jgi:hypothetical protein
LEPSGLCHSRLDGVSPYRGREGGVSGLTAENAERTKAEAVKIKVRNQDPYRARIIGRNITSSCTMGKHHAAVAVAKKHFGGRPFTVKFAGANQEWTWFEAQGRAA